MDYGVTAAADALGGKAWTVVGQTYTPKLRSGNAFIWHAVIPTGTFVPPHIHPLQDEWIYVLEGHLEIEFGDEKHPAGPGDTVFMSKGIAHGIFNRSGKTASCTFGVAPTGRLFELFGKLDGVTDPVELVRISAEHDVDFLPPPG